MSERITAADVTRLVDLKRQMDALKSEKDELEGKFLRDAEAQLVDTKRRIVHYPGDNGNRVAVGHAVTVKVPYPSLLKRVFGDAYADMVREDTKYELSAPAKRLLAGIFLGNYISEVTRPEVLRLYAADEDAFKTLLKKVHGINPQKDAQNLVSLAGLTEDKAEECAYLCAEAEVWEQFIGLMNAAGHTDSEACIHDIHRAVVAEETLKVTIQE